MSVAERIPEPSMEEILSSIRRAISEDHSRAQASNDAGDPFGADSAATSEFSSSLDGKAFDTSAHERHDPFATLNAKLDERRQRDENAEHEFSSNASPATEPDVGRVEPVALPKHTSAPKVEASRGDAPRFETPVTEKPGSSFAVPHTKPVVSPPVTPTPNRERPPPSISTPREPVHAHRVAEARANTSVPTPAADFKPFSDAFAAAGRTTTTPSNVGATPAAHPFRRPSTPPVQQSSTPAQPAAPADSYERSLLTSTSDAVTSAAFDRLSQSMAPKAAGTKTVEDIVVEILTPIVTQWLDQYLPELVEELVRLEIERVARQRG